MEIDQTFIAAILTVIGYQINDTVVVFDRIRENNRNHEFAKLKREEVVNISVTQCLGRTTNTTLTTLFTVVSLYIMGVASIREFTLPIIIGILAGLYSSNLMAGYYWAYLEEHYLNRRKNAKPGAKAQKEGFGAGSTLDHRYGNGDGEIHLETFSGDAELVLE